jgi:hypothetical protein
MKELKDAEMPELPDVAILQTVSLRSISDAP